MKGGILIAQEKLDRLNHSSARRRRAPVTEAQCRICHDALQNPEFPFAEKRNRVAH